MWSKSTANDMTVTILHVLIVGVCLNLTFSHPTSMDTAGRSRSRYCPKKLEMLYENSCYAVADPPGCYCLIEKSTTRSEADQLCRSSGMDLVSIRTAQEHDAIEQLFTGRGEMMWTSGVRQSVPGNAGETVKESWTWSATGQPVESMVWSANEPSSENGEDFIRLGFEGGVMGWSAIGSKPTDDEPVFPLCEAVELEQDYQRTSSDTTAKEIETEADPEDYDFAQFKPLTLLYQFLKFVEEDLSEEVSESEDENEAPSKENEVDAGNSKIPGPGDKEISPEEMIARFEIKTNQKVPAESVELLKMFGQFYN